jgi:sulfotransferase
MPTLYFISGLPRSGANLLSNILNQNPQIHTEPVSSLCDFVSNVNHTWLRSEANQVQDHPSNKLSLLKGMLGCYHDTPQSVIFDNNPHWVRNINLLEQVLCQPVKILVPVRNPAEILASFERLRKQNPMSYSPADQALGDRSTIASRAFHYAGPEGVLGTSHAMIRDAVTMGYLDRMLFIDYNRFCNSPRSQIKRIYDFFGLPEHQHDFDCIQQQATISERYQHFYQLKPKLLRTTVNCVEYLGLDLYQQYNREIFWDAWI